MWYLLSRHSVQKNCTLEFNIIHQCSCMSCRLVSRFYLWMGTPTNPTLWSATRQGCLRSLAPTTDDLFSLRGPLIAASCHGKLTWSKVCLYTGLSTKASGWVVQCFVAKHVFLQCVGSSSCIGRKGHGTVLYAFRRRKAWQVLQGEFKFFFPRPLPHVC